MFLKSRISIFIIFVLVLTQIIMPFNGLAEDKDEPPSRWDPATTKIISTNPAITPLFEMTSDGERGPSGFFNAGFNAEGISLDTVVEIKISADEKPFMLMNMGDLQSWSYDETSKIVTVNTKPIDFYHIDRETSNEFHMPSFIAIGFGPNPGGEESEESERGGRGDRQGPPAEADGMWMSTNATQWEMRPSEDGDGDGMPSSMVLKLTGKAGKAGFFKMFWPTPLLEKMGLTADTLAGFINGTQASTTTKKVDGGVIITFNVTFSSTGFPQPKLIKSAATPSGFNTITVSTGKAAALTIAQSKKSVKKGKAVLISGYVNPKKAKTIISLYRKLKGEKAYKKVGTAKTSNKGFYRFTRKLPKTAYLKTAIKKGGKLVYSDVIKVIVK